MQAQNFLTKRPILVIMLAILAHLSMSAAYQLDIHKIDGTNESIRLDRRPVITFSDTDMILTVNSATIAILRSDIQNLDFSECVGVITPTDDKGNIIEVIDANTLRINSQAVAVYDVAGRTVTTASVATNGEASEINLTACPTGVYIITYNNSSIKITKK